MRRRVVMTRDVMTRGDSYFEATVLKVQFAERSMVEITARTGSGDFDIGHMVVTHGVGKECADLIGKRVRFSVTVEPVE